MELGFISNTFSQKTPSAISSYNSVFHITYRIIPLCSFNGKEKDPESGFHYYGARYYWSELLTGWLSVDPMADKYPGISPYAYCAWNPVKLVDPDGRKERPFGKDDREVSIKKGTSTFIFKYDNYGNRVGVNPNFANAYKCHSFAWHHSQGDPTPAPNDIPLVGLNGVYYGTAPKWDNSPADDIIEQGAVQLGANENNIPGDKVIYYYDKNGNGVYDAGEFIAHSAVVQTVDEEGYTTTVIGKMGEDGISVNHPCAPGYYEGETNRKTGEFTPYSRAYFRVPSEKTTSSYLE